jgi:hypothetical protein
MRIELWIFFITIFFIVNAYYEYSFTNKLLHYKKYYQMAAICILGFGIYLLFKKNPLKSKEFVEQTKNFIQVLPIDKSTTSFIHPILDFTQKHQPPQPPQPNSLPQKTTKRSVSETKKKFVASNQNWKCGECKNQLDHTFEIDHCLRLEYGGTNEVHNLIALCRNCHGKKTAKENMGL